MSTPRLLPAFYLFLWRACPNTQSYLKCSTNPGGRVVWLQCEQFMPGTWNLSINNPLCQNLQQHPVAKNVVKLSSSPIVDQEGRRGQGRTTWSCFHCEKGKSHHLNSLYLLLPNRQGEIPKLFPGRSYYDFTMTQKDL